MAEKDYYQILGVDRNATKDEINHAFKKLALQFHPDRWVGKSEKEQKEAEEKFKDINEAYQTLSDPDKRAKYDNPVNDDFGAWDDFGGFNPFNGSFDPFKMFRNRQQQRVIIGDDINITIDVTIYEAYNGAKKNITYIKKVHCPDCNGTGSADGKEKTCPHCNGTGTISEKKQNGYMISIITKPCPHCNGTGKIIENPCKTCNGSGLKTVTVTEQIEVPKGIFNGAQIDFPNLGSEPKGEGRNGHLIVTYRIKEDDYFKIDGFCNVYHIENVKFNEALLGCEREIKFLDGTTKKIKIPEGTKDNTNFTYNKKGMFNIQNGNTEDYNVIIKYVYPEKLTKEQKKMLEEFKW